MTVKAIEFYSGIGGMHYALKEASPDSCVLAACDINTTANEIYEFNFPKTRLLQNNVQAVTVDKLDKMEADLWMMSPPCQPFTKKGLQRGADDKRCDSLFALMEKLKVMKSRPSYILLENVVGFETSTVHDAIVEILNELGYGLKECILSPLQFGIPNSRPRYYLMASNNLPATGVAEDISDFLQQSCSNGSRAISAFLDESSLTPSLFLDKDVLEKYGCALDVTLASSTRSACFTKSYGSYISGCGSYFCYRSDLVINKHLTKTALENLENLSQSVRRFSPREVANLMCFPEDFKFPQKSSHRQLYQCLGNSINVHVVAVLLKFLLNC